MSISEYLSEQEATELIVGGIKRMPDREYHNSSHATRAFALTTRFEELLSDREFYALQVAAAWHDTGYSVDPDNHEEASVELLREYINQYDFEYVSSSEVEEMLMPVVEDVIMATVAELESVDSPLQPNAVDGSLIERAMADIDVSNFGDSWDVFNKANEDVREELGYNEVPDDEWLEMRTQLLEMHSWKTNVIPKEFDNKEENMERLREISS